MSDLIGDSWILIAIATICSLIEVLWGRSNLRYIVGKGKSILIAFWKIIVGIFLLYYTKIQQVVVS